MLQRLYLNPILPFFLHKIHDITSTYTYIYVAFVLILPKKNVHVIKYFSMFWFIRGHRGRGRMVVEFTTTYTIGTYHHYRCEFETHSGDTTLFDKVCRQLTTGRWFTPVTLVCSTNKTDRHYITEILLKVVLNTINETNQTIFKSY